MNVMARARQLLAGARAYRFDGEEQNHEDQRREREVSLSLMANATDDPDQVRMASEIEEDAENRLAVLVGKARLSIAEKRERDAIQKALQTRRQSFDTTAPPTRIRGFLGAVPALGVLGGVRLWMIGGVAVIAALGWWRIEVATLKHARDRGCTRLELQGETTRRPCVDLASVQRDLTVRNVELSNANAALDGARRAAVASRDAAIAADRRAALAAARERRRNSEVVQVVTGGGPPDWERSLRDDESVQPGAPAASGGDAAGGDRP